MPITDANLIALLTRTAEALDREAADLIDVDVDDDGRQRGGVPARDRDYFAAVTEQAQALRDLAGTIRDRQHT